MLCRKLAVTLALVGCLGLPKLEAAKNPKPAVRTSELPGDDQAELAIKGFEIPKGFQCELVAAEPLVANPVCFSIDEQGRFYVAETFRLGGGVPDIRGRMSWLDTELASKSVAERVAYTRRLEPNNEEWWTNNQDRVSLIWDTNGDGKCDQSVVFAGNFNGLAEGIGSGVLARHGDIYYADIPNLWLLRDTNRDGIADFKKSLSYGYGVRYGFIGHDLHGLQIGPDGRLYFSIGDRGAHIVQPKGKVDSLETGAVFRCELDGSNLEIFYTGLRNPQELTFDDYGNLWTCDNNSDAGDPARVVYLAEGGDSGWRIGWQFIEHPMARSSWLGERICYEDFPGRAAYALPPVSSNVGNGPSGLTFDPGVGLPPEWRGRFFMANFSGNPNSGIFAFTVRSKGAGFELGENDKFWWHFLPTDVDFGYDGCIYASDWIDGWGKAGGTGRGRIYRLYQPDERNRPAVAQAKRLFAEGFEQRSNTELTRLLAHPDRRVRCEAQFALVTHKASRELSQMAASGPTLFSRLHAIWGLGQLERNGKHADFKKLLTDAQPEVRAQTAKVLGDAKDARFEKQLIALLSDSESRVRYFAGMTLGKLGGRKSVLPVLAMLRQGGDDPWLRHAGVVALVGCASEKELGALSSDGSATVRLAATIALRRLGSPKLQSFLSDGDPRIVADAARAINDLPVTNALPSLAALAEHIERFASLPAGSQTEPSPRDAILRRIVNANLRIGTPAAAVRLAAMIASEQLPEMVRLEAVSALSGWSKPDGKDHVSGLWRPLPERLAPDFATLQSNLRRTLTGSASEKIKTALLATAAKMRWQKLDEAAFSFLKSTGIGAPLRVATLEFLGAVDSPKLGEALSLASDSDSDELRIAALKLAAKVSGGERLVAVISNLLKSGTKREKQNAYAMLGDLKDPGADRVLTQRLEDFLKRKVAGEVQLDLLEAAAKRSDAQIKEKLAKFYATRAGKTNVDSFSECLMGGDAASGQKIFRENVQAVCLRCHKISGEGGEAAPDLTHIASRADRAYILESITFPNAKIAPGFENIQVVLKNSLSHVGIVKRETDDELDLLTQEDGLVKIKKTDIKARAQTLSGMLDNLREVLSKREIRDLVEYLSGLK